MNQKMRTARDLNIRVRSLVSELCEERFQINNKKSRSRKAELSHRDYGICATSRALCLKLGDFLVPFSSMYISMHLWEGI